MDQVTTFLVGMGLPGVCIIGLGYACTMLYKRNQALTDTLLGVVEKYATTTGTNTSSINRLADLLAIRKEGGQ